MLQKIKLKIEGMHCKSCKEIIEGELTLLSGIKSVKISDKEGLCEIIFKPAEISIKEIKNVITGLNYKVRKVTQEKIQKQSFLKKIIPPTAFVLSIIFIYFLILKLDLFQYLSRLNESNLGYGLIFLIGVLASFHCMGMCGGLVIAYASRFYQDKKQEKTFFKPHFFYNLGRVMSYTLTGFLLGGIGSFFGVSIFFRSLITILAGFFMIMVGISLISKINLIEKLTGFLPKNFSFKILRLIQSKNPHSPFFIGFMTGFMPCGALQAVQIYALSTQSALTGGLSMFFYALGTAPLMFLFGGFISFLSREKIFWITRLSAVIVIILGLFTLNRGLETLKSKTTEKNESVPLETTKEEVKTPFQEVKTTLLFEGYSPKSLKAKVNVPIRFIIDAKEISGCTEEIIIPQFNIRKKLKPGLNIIEFTPRIIGDVQFSCGMKMVWGKIIITN